MLYIDWVKGKIWFNWGYFLFVLWIEEELRLRKFELDIDVFIENMVFLFFDSIDINNIMLG